MPLAMPVPAPATSKAAAASTQAMPTLLGSPLVDLLSRKIPGPLRDVVHVHPGDAQVLEWAGGRHAQRVFAVTPDATVLSDLPAHKGGSARIRAIRKCVAGQGGDMEWRRYNMQELNGPGLATGLHQRYPRLRLLERLPLRAVSPAELVQQLKPVKTPGKANLLVIDGRGDELALLQGWSAELLQPFDWVALRSPRPGLFETGAAHEALRGELASRDFTWVPGEETPDPLWQLDLFRFDEVMAVRNAMRREIDAMERRMADGERLHAQAAATAAEQQRALRTQVKVLEAQLEQGRAERESAERNLEEARKMATRLSGELERSHQRVQELRTEGEAARERMKAQGRELQDARQTAALAVRLHALKDLDLRELQVRHAAMVAAQDRQKALLLALGDKLRAARQHLQPERKDP